MAVRGRLTDGGRDYGDTLHDLRHERKLLAVWTKRFGGEMGQKIFGLFKLYNAEIKSRENDAADFQLLEQIANEIDPKKPR